MARIELQKLRKTYPPDVVALDNVDLEIETGEFFTLLGPSGCGKTTLLRTIAGFNLQDSGAVLIDGKRIDHVPAYRRDTGMVFQDYAIFPHMSVADNVAFGLRNRKVPEAEISERVEVALAMARLEGFGDRLPSQLSGGQQQRVGMARAVVIRPQVLLMDEPLSNLDAKLRIELREDVRKLQRELGITTIYVTHDQEEALVISDRICVMRNGVVHQVGTPWEIYREPKSQFVAGFVGAMNFLPGRLTMPEGRSQPNLKIDDHEVAWPNSAERAGDVTVAIRPEHITADAATAGASGFVLDGRVSFVSFTGREVQYTVDLPGEQRVEVHIADPSPELMDKNGKDLSLLLSTDRLLLFDPSSGARWT